MAKTSKRIIKRRRHAMRRAALRFNLELSAEEYDAAVRLIQSGKATLLFRESQSRTHWKILIRDQGMRAVYHKGDSLIVTFLPLEEAA